VGDLAIAAGAIAYVDANVLIYAVERIQPYASLLRPIWEAARSNTATLIGSELLIIENAHRSAQAGRSSTHRGVR